jgi:hypothetical protein
MVAACFDRNTDGPQISGYVADFLAKVLANQAIFRKHRRYRMPVNLTGTFSEEQNAALLFPMIAIRPFIAIVLPRGASFCVRRIHTLRLLFEFRPISVISSPPVLGTKHELEGELMNRSRAWRQNADPNRRI